jgi:RHS repeat-associated protein
VTIPFGNVTSTTTTAFDNSTVIKTTTTDYAYLHSPYSAFYDAGLMSLPYTVTVSGAGNQSVTQYTYDQSGSVCPTGSGVYGHPTSVGDWLNTAYTYVTTTTAYNCQGMPTSTTDANGNLTTIAYDSAGLFPSSITHPPTSGISHIDYYSYDDATGHLNWHTDWNGAAPTGSTPDPAHTTFYTYGDPLYRLTKVLDPPTAAGTGETDIAYNDTARTVTTTMLASPDPSIVAKKTFDGLGRQIQSVLSSDPSGPDITNTSYDARGRVASVSNPYRSPAASGDPPTGTTYFTYDAMGRTTIQTQPDSSTLQSCYNDQASTGQTNCATNASSFAGSQTDTTDEAGHHTQRVSDALGRLVAAMEPNPSTGSLALETDYGYDVLGNLTSVNQTGNPSTETPRVRTFMYDSLSRLTQSCNPEGLQTGTNGQPPCIGWNWSNQYTYYPNGNLQSKKDARWVTTNYTYDALNRMQTKTASDGSFAYTYTWDASPGIGTLPSGQTNSIIGRLGQATNGVNASEQYAYDAMGRVVYQTNCLPSNWSNCAQPGNAFAAQYDLTGNITGITYPDGSQIQQAWDSAGHLCNVMSGTTGITCATSAAYNSLSSPSSFPSYFSSASYFPNGSIGGFTLGNGVTQTNSSNNRLQPTEISVKNPAGVGYMDKQYCYAPLTSGCQSSSANDNGNIFAVLNGIDPTRNQIYTYDKLNRISGFSSSQATPAMQQTFSIDSFGNMNMSGTLSSGLSFSQNPNNHIDGYGYDGAGNVNQVPSPLGGSTYYNFDAESKLISIGTPWSPSASYTYDANGERVRKATSGSWTEYAYFGGVPLAENNSTGGWTDYIFANGQRIARVDPVQTIDIRFPDDSCSGCSTGDTTPGEDRNLFVNSVTVGSTVVTPGNSSASFTYVFPGCVGPCPLYQDGEASLVSMYWQGDVIVTNPPAGSPITINAWSSPDYNIYADMQVSLNGVLAGDWITTANAQNYTVYPTHFYSSDHLGTTTVITNGQGALESDSDYYPYGTESPVTSSADPNHYKFTGKERDIESGLDYFGARFFGSNMGRFMSPDWSATAEPVPYAKLDDPQSLNLYGYVGNNPLGRVDADGHCARADPEGSFQDACAGGPDIDERDDDLGDSSGVDGAGFFAKKKDCDTHGDPVPCPKPKPPTIPDPVDIDLLFRNYWRVPFSPPRWDLRPVLPHMQAYRPPPSHVQAPTARPPIKGDLSCLVAPDVVSAIHSLQQGQAYGPPQASTDGEGAVSINRNTTQGIRSYGNQTAYYSFNAGFALLDGAVSAGNCLQGR